MKILKINKKSILELFLSILFLIPFYSIRIVRDNLNIEVKNLFLDSNITILLILIFLFMLIIIFSKYKRNSKSSKKIKKIILFKIIVDILLILLNLYKDISQQYFWIQFLWIALPMYFSLLYVLLIDKLELNYRKIIYYGIVFFVLYVVVNLLINVFIYDFDFTEDRLISTGGGPVIYGYTIVLVLSLLLIFEDLFSRKQFTIIVILLFIGSIFTGSRASIIPFVVIIIFYLLYSRRYSLVFKSFLIGILAISIIMPNNLLVLLVPRITNLYDGSRFDTLLNSIKVFNQSNVEELLTGYGLSGFFPYQEWLNSSNRGAEFINYNTFNFNGYSFLVQPHNSFVYMLMETGLIGFLLLVGFISYYLIYFISKKDYMRTLFVFTFAFLNMFDSVIFVAPDSASLWWTMLFIVILSSNIQSSNNKMIFTQDFIHRNDVSYIDMKGEQNI